MSNNWWANTKRGQFFTHHRILFKKNLFLPAAYCVTFNGTVDAVRSAMILACGQIIKHLLSMICIQVTELCLAAGISAAFFAVRSTFVCPFQK